MSDSHQHHSEHASHHILPIALGMKIFGLLLVLTAVTVFTAKQLHFGWLNFPIAMLIATVKAMLVCLWFMGLKYDSNESRTIFFGSFIFVAIFIVLTATDIFFRGEVPMKADFGKGGTQKARFKKPWMPSSEILAHGKGLYEAQCTSCHGPGGKGDGPAAAALNPGPRDFTKDAAWINGRKPSQVFATLTTGVNKMPSFGSLPAEDRWALVHHVLAFGAAPPKDTAEDYKKLSIDPSGDTLGGGSAEKVLPVDFAIEQMKAD